MNELIYSHRPVLGTTVGAFSENGKLYISVALVNDGTSSNGLMHKDRRDAFSRARGRAIVNGRLNRMVNDGKADQSHGRIYMTDLSAREFMYKFRKVFKPTVDESDDTFAVTKAFGGVEVRERPSARFIMDTVFNLVSEVLTDHAEVSNPQ